MNETTENRKSNGKRLRIGGMALENGVLFQTDRVWTMGIRGDDGEIRVVSGRKTGLDRSSPARRLLLLRGRVVLRHCTI